MKYNYTDSFDEEISGRVHASRPLKSRYYWAAVAVTLALAAWDRVGTYPV